MYLSYIFSYNYKVVLVELESEKFITMIINLNISTQYYHLLVYHLDA